MTDINISHEKDGTSREKSEIRNIPCMGLKSEDMYSLETACEILRVGTTRMKEIRRKYVGNGVYRQGHDYFCYGKDLMRIIVEGCESDE